MQEDPTKVISLPYFQEFEFENSGNVLKNAVCLGDVDNDGLNELVIGNDKGDIAFFKGDSTVKLIAKCEGMVSALAIGDAMNIGRNVILAITERGQCSLYTINKENWMDSTRKPLIPLHTQRIIANVKVVLIGDINGDGFFEIVVGLTDRVVRTYRWVQASLDEKSSGKFVALNKWEFGEQIGTITINKSSDQKPCILISQPSGTFLSMKVDPQYHHQADDATDEPSEVLLTKITLLLEPLASSKFHNSEISGNIKFRTDEESQKGSPFAVVTLGGYLMLVQDGKILWNRFVDKELFAVDSLDLNGDGNDEVVACAWDGTTFVVDRRTNCVQFFFKEPVNAFVAGQFGWKNRQTNCFVYVTFNNRVFLYYDLNICCSPATPPLKRLIKNTDYTRLVQSMGIDICDNDALMKLNSHLLYGDHNS